MEVLTVIAGERRAFARDLAGLTPEQWMTPSLCAGWTVRDVVAHITVPLTIRPRAAITAFLRGRGSIDRTIALLTAERAELPVDRLLRDLEERAESTTAPPGAGLRAPMTDLLVHGLDVRRPLGLEREVPDEAWRQALAFLTSNRALGFVPRGRTAGLAIEATDVGWSWGDGRALRGPAPSLALALTGRATALDELVGPGVDVLRDRLRS